MTKSRGIRKRFKSLTETERTNMLQWLPLAAPHMELKQREADCRNAVNKAAKIIARDYCAILRANVEKVKLKRIAR